MRGGDTLVSKVSTHPEMKLLQEAGQGRPFLLVHEHQEYEPFAAACFQVLSSKAKVWHVVCKPLTPDNWQTCLLEAVELLQAKGIRYVSAIGLGAAAGLVQSLALASQGAVRSVVLLDATGRPHPSFWMRFVDMLEQKLPLGLPFRSAFAGFDARPVLHRLRCPALVITTNSASEYVRSEARRFKTILPCAWYEDLVCPAAAHGDTVSNQNEQVQQCAELVFRFSSVPVKCPQRG